MNAIIDVEKIRTISHASHSAEVAITALALRQRLRDFTDLVRLKAQLIHDGEKVVEKDFLTMFMSFQKLGYGTIVYEKRGRKNVKEIASRFDWSVSFKIIAEAALEGLKNSSLKLSGATIPELSKAVPVVAKPEASMPTPKREMAVKTVKRNSNKLAMAARAAAIRSMPIAQQPSTRTLFVQLRDNFAVEVTVPSDFSKSEAEVIANQLKRLAA